MPTDPQVRAASLAQIEATRHASKAAALAGPDVSSGCELLPLRRLWRALRTGNQVGVKAASRNARLYDARTQTRMHACTHARAQPRSTHARIATRAHTHTHAHTHMQTRANERAH
eukprot:2433622-Pleurochrysis_carterae.AAC.2